MTVDRAPADRAPEVRRMFDAVGLTVSNLKRVRINKLQLPSSLPVGQYIEVAKEDIL